MTVVKTLGLLLISSIVMLGNLFAQEEAASSAITDPAAPATVPTSQSTGAQTELQQRYPRYRVTREDVLSLSFPLSPEFNRQARVQPDGFINLQSADSLYVVGLTIPEVIEALKRAYAKVLHNPIIDVDVVEFQKAYMIVGGQVSKPGQYDLRHDTTVSQAIAIAGGLTPDAKSQVFLFHKTSPNWVEVKKLNLKDIYHGKKANEDAQLQPGDTIFVPATFISKFRKYVPYSTGTYVDPATLLGK